LSPFKENNIRMSFLFLDILKQTNYLAGERADHRALSVLQHESAVGLVNYHLRAIFRAILIIWLAEAKKRARDGAAAIRAPFETSF